MKLTKTAIDAMTFEGRAPKSRDLRWDDEVPGFGVRIWPSGKKTFFVLYRHLGRERFMTLGPMGVLTLQQARDLAREAKVKVLRGKDPLGERQRQAEGGTFGDFAELYLTRHASKKKSGADDEGMLRNHVLPVWKNRPLATIHHADVAKLHAQLSAKTKALPAAAERKGKAWKKGRAAGGPYVANRVVAMLSKMFNLSKKWGYLPQNAANPATGIDRNKEAERERYVTPEELRRLAAEIEREPNLFVRQAIWGYLITGVRKSTLLRLEWRHIDYTLRTVTYPLTKKGKPFVAPLTSHLELLLGTIPKLSGNPYVFCGRLKGRHLVSINKNWERIREACGLADVRIHDLRHTVVTWLANAGYSLALIGKAVDQTNERTTRRYAHLQLKPVGRILEAHGAQLKAVIAAKDESELSAIFDTEGHHSPSTPSSVDSSPPSDASGSR